MKNLAILFFLFIFALSSNAQTPKTTPRKSPKPVKTVAVKLGTEEDELEKARIVDAPSARITALQAFIKNFPESALLPRAQTLIVTARAELGVMRFQAKDIKGGVGFYRLAIEDSPTPVPDEIFSKVLIGLPVSLYRLDERAAAFDIAKLIEERVGANAAQILDLARFYLNVEYGTEAIRLAQKAVEIAPASAEAYQTLAAANRLNFRLDDAAAAYAKAAEFEGEQSAASKLNLAEMKRALGKADEAVALYREILAREPENKPAQAGLALALFDAGKRAEAEAEMKKALELDPTNARLMTGAAYWYAARGLNEQAIEYSRKAIVLEPRNVWSYIAQARALTAQGKPLDAEKVLLQARQYSDFPTLDYELATVRLAAGLYREAAETLRRSFKVNNDGTVETYLGNRILADANSFTELLSLERRVALFETNAAENEEAARKLKTLLEFSQKLDAPDATEEEIALAAEQFADGTDNMRLHRQLFAADRLLQKKMAFPKVLELMQAAINSVDSALNVASPSAAVLADEIYDSRDYAIKQNLIIVVPEIPRPTLSAILRGRIEDTAARALFRQNNLPQAIVRLKRALSVLPDKSAWSRASYWNLGEALMADGKDKEALEAYIKSFDKDFPNAERRAFIENLYVKVNGNVDGLDDRIGPKPETTVATTGSKNTPTNTDNVTPEPTPAPLEAKPETLPTPAPQVAETPQPTEVKPEPSPQTEATPEATPEVKPEATPDVKPEATPEIKPEPSPVLPQVVPDETPETKPEPSPEVTPQVEDVKNTETIPTQIKPEPSPDPSPTETTPATDEVAPVPTPTDAKTEEQKPSENKPEEAIPSENKPEENIPADKKPEETTPSDKKPEPSPVPSPQSMSVVVTDTLAQIPPARVNESTPEANRQKPIFDPVIISVGKNEPAPSRVKPEPTPAVENKTEEKPAEKTNDETPTDKNPPEQVKTPEVVITENITPENKPPEKQEPAPTETEPENKPAEKQTDERILSGERRPRIIITENTGAKTVTEEISTCKLVVSPDVLSLLNGDGSLGVNVSFEGEGDFRDIRALPSSPEDIEVRLDTEVGASRNRAFFIVKSRSAKTGVFTVVFEAPCGKKEIIVRVR